MIKLISDVKISLNIIKKRNIEKGINGILKALGLKFDWIKRMLAKSDESDDFSVKLKYVKELMEGIA